MIILKEKVWWVFTCKACKTKCQAEPSDVRATPDPDADGDVLTYNYVVECGKCGAEREVPNKKLTERIMKSAQRRKRK